MARRLWIFVVALCISFGGLGLAGPAWSAQKAPAVEQAQTPVNLNTAGVDQLKQLKGIGEKTAQAIVEYREKNGPFQKVEDLLQVKGIGEKKLEELRGQVTVE
jgi:competence protein ComEA